MVKEKYRRPNYDLSNLTREVDRLGGYQLNSTASQTLARQVRALVASPIYTKTCTPHQTQLLCAQTPSQPRVERICLEDVISP